MKYQVITACAYFSPVTDFERAARELSELVNQAILDGWRPLGGVAAGNTENVKPYLLQAMVRD